MLVDLVRCLAQRLARGCLSSAWVGFNAASHAWMLAMWPSAAQDAIWGESPGAVISSSLLYPAGKAVAVADGSGLLFSGKWAFSSGVDHADFVMLGAMLEVPGGAQKKVIGIVRKDQLTVIDTWHVSGLKGTGSKNLNGDGLFVPTDWVVENDSLSDGSAPGLLGNEAAVYRVPVFGMFPHLTAAVMIGNAQGCYDEFLLGSAARRTTYSRTPAAQLVSLQMRVAKAGALIRSALYSSNATRAKPAIWRPQADCQARKRSCSGVAMRLLRRSRRRRQSTCFSRRMAALATIRRTPLSDASVTHTRR
jgi:3-hydroxy-9,10-secoandrosta-1,3,5(10)-triene-9,17-dione monooxygenase